MENKPEATQNVYIDKFQFVTAKKYLSLEGPINFKTVHDRMYPLIKYGQEVKVERKEGAFKYGDILAAWEEEFLYFGLYMGKSDEHIQLYFTKNRETKSFPESLVLGQVSNVSVPLSIKIKLRVKSLFKAA